MKPKLRCGRFLCTTLVTLYINLILSNLVSLRQYWYVHQYLNQTQVLPLYDSLFMDWIGEYKNKITDYVTLHDAVDICTYSWVILTIVAWTLFSQKPSIMAKGLMAQVVLISSFSLAQLLTIVPDSMPNCLEVYNIPTDSDISWIFWHYPIRACGNMLWSSDVTQLVIFTSLAVEIIPREKNKTSNMVWFVGECWTFSTMIFIFSSRYQYSVDVITTYVVVKLVMSNPSVDFWSKWFFVENGEYFERVTMQEYQPYETI
jgi:hypothetical protein